MPDTQELKKIKKIYGEKFKNLCREMFQVILEREGTLLPILERKFAHNCNSLYEEITEQCLEEEFRELIYRECDLTREKEEQEQEMTEDRTPYEILDEAGYDLYECETEEEIQCFRKFYAQDEVLCTIYEGGRLDTRACFFAVRKDVETIRREDFKHPEKTDKYSLSVLGIQFTREKRCITEIISRYNHKVDLPNCTLGNDLDRLAPGLKQSFAKLLEERGLYLDSSRSEKDFQLPGYTLANDGRYYKYNMEINGMYYCPGNIIISNREAKEVIAPEKGIVIDNFLLDLENKEIKIIDSTLRDSFVDNIKDIEKIEIKRVKDNVRIIKITLAGKKEPVIIGIDRDNQIIRYENQYIQQIGNDFLCYNTELEKINLPKVQRIGNNFLCNNIELTEINLPELQRVGNNFLCYNLELTKINLPKAKQVGDQFLGNNAVLAQINMPELQRVGSGFLFNNVELDEINMSKLKQVGDYFLLNNNQLTKINMPKLQRAGDYFLSYNAAIAKINFPELQQVGDHFLRRNEGLTKINMPKLQRAGEYFLNNATRLTDINIPQLSEFENRFRFQVKGEQNTTKEITPVDIARLDQKSGITKETIKKSGKLIEKTLGKEGMER